MSDETTPKGNQPAPDKEVSQTDSGHSLLPNEEISDETGEKKSNGDKPASAEKNEGSSPSSQGILRWIYKETRLSDWIITLFTAVIAVATICQGCIAKRAAIDAGIQTEKLICAADRQATAAEKMKDAAERQAGAGEQFANSASHLEGIISAAEKDLSKSAATSEKAINAAQEAMHAEQRAWVFPSAVLPPTLKVGDKLVYINTTDKLRFFLTIVNTGKSPAIDMHHKITSRPFPKGQFSPIYPLEENPPSLSVLVPGIPQFMFTDETPGVASPEQIEMFKSGTVVYYIYGIIEYKDIFKTPRTSTFCFYVGKDLSSINVCDTYNTAN